LDLKSSDTGFLLCLWNNKAIIKAASRRTICGDIADGFGGAPSWSGGMPNAGEEEYALRVCETGAVPAYEAVHRMGGSGRLTVIKQLLAAGAGLVALALVGAVLLSADRNQAMTGAPSARAVSEAAASLSIGKAPAVIPGDTAPTELSGAPGDYGSLRNVPEEGYNIFDPHYSHDGVPNSHPGGTTNGVFTGHSGPSSRGGPLTFGPNTYWNVFNPDGSPDRGPCDPVNTCAYACVCKCLRANMHTHVQACAHLVLMTALALVANRTHPLSLITHTLPHTRRDSTGRPVRGQLRAIAMNAQWPSGARVGEICWKERTAMPTIVRMSPQHSLAPTRLRSVHASPGGTVLRTITWKTRAKCAWQTPIALAPPGRAGSNTRALSFRPLPMRRATARAILATGVSRTTTVCCARPTIIAREETLRGSSSMRAR
jgi:hypothetical protein